MLPCNFAKWQLVYYYYKKWSGLDCFGLLLAKFREKVRVGMWAKQGIKRLLWEQKGERHQAACGNRQERFFAGLDGNGGPCTRQ